jgi:4-alpha-glucanotransferase
MESTKRARSSGVLLHPTSLPGPHGIGDLGQSAHDFVDWLARAGQTFWQVLPLGPTGYGDSPYQSFSSFGGNPLLISLDELVADGYLSATELAGAPVFPAQAVDFGPLITWKNGLLRRAARAFAHAQRPGHLADFHHFCDAQAAWLDDYALFAAAKDQFGGAVWNTWPAGLANRERPALDSWGKTLSEDILRIKFQQWYFFRQWRALKRRANEQGIRIIGDLPIFVAYDSADVWAHPEQYYLDKAGNPTVVAGVPPDYFSATGQLWGNPLYRWDVMAGRGFDWWIARVRATLAVVDVVRIDHFRGFEAYWEVPAGEQTAINGRWVPGPGEALFDALARAQLIAPAPEGAVGAQSIASPREDAGETPRRAELGPIIAEDLGVITPPVVALRERYGFPGMKILQFAFGPGADNPLPHTFERNCVAYTGTHDNDTAMGWFASASPEARQHALDYMSSDGRDFAWDLIRLGSMSVADTFIAPMQDLLSLGSEARMNFPSKPSGNWGWRMADGATTEELAARLHNLSVIYGRV